MTTTMNDNTNTSTGNNEQQMVGLKIHHVSSPWHDHHITMSLLDMSSPLPSPSPHSCFHEWSVSDSWISFFHITNNINNDCLQFAHLISPFICCTQYYTHILRVSFLTFFSSFFNILIILSIRSTAATPPHHHHRYLQPTPNKIGSRHVCLSSLRFFFFFFFFHLYCTNVYLLSPPNMSQWAPHLDDRRLTSTPTYPVMKRAWLTPWDISPALGSFFPLLFFFFYNTNIYLWLDHTASPQCAWPWDCCVDMSKQHQNSHPMTKRAQDTSWALVMCCHTTTLHITTGINTTNCLDVTLGKGEHSPRDGQHHLLGY